MTEGETLFYLREIHPHWSTSNVSLDKLAELETATLIELNRAPVPAVRLTAEGAKQKAQGRRTDGNDRVVLTNKPRTTRHRSPKKTVPRAKPLV